MISMTSYTLIFLLLNFLWTFSACAPRVETPDPAPTPQEQAKNEVKVKVDPEPSKAPDRPVEGNLERRVAELESQIVLIRRGIMEIKAFLFDHSRGNA